MKVPDGKIGKKKMEKLQAKADKKREREAEVREREEAKKKREQEEEEAKKQQSREAEEEKRREEEERQRREERERQEQEEYLKLKAAFTVEDEGCDAEEDNEENKLQKFISYIQVKNRTCSRHKSYCFIVLVILQQNRRLNDLSSEF